VAAYPIAELGARVEDLEINPRGGGGEYGYPPLQEAIAAKCGVSKECVVAASGTSMANYLIMAALIQPGDEVLIEQPAYEPLLALARHLGADVKRFQRPFHMQFNPVLSLEIVSRRTKLIVLTNLHNPSSALIQEPQMRSVGEIAQSVGARVLVDEVYLECLYEKARSSFHLGKEFIVTGSLTKAYGLGGLRCGWVLAEPELASRIWRIKDLIDPGAPHPADCLSVVALQRLGEIAGRAKALLSANRELLAGFMNSCRYLDFVPTDHGTCVFPRLFHGDMARLLSVLRGRYEIEVVPGAFFEMPDHFRLGIGGDTKTLAAGLDRMNDALGAVVE
jgi:aspartate/methionine/tyrosine aminotransferase